MNAGFAFEELRFHLVITFEAAAGEDHRAARFDRALDAVVPDADTAHFAPFGVGNQAQRRRREPDLDAVLQHVVVHHLEQFRTIGSAVGPRVVGRHVESRHVHHRGVIKSFRAGKRIVAAQAAPVGVFEPTGARVVLDRGSDRRIVDPAEFAQVRLDSAHPVRQRAQHIVWRAPVVGGLEIGECALRIARAARRAVGADRQSAGHFGFLDQQRLRTALRGVDRRYPAGEAEADYDHIKSFVKLHRCLELMGASSKINRQDSQD